MLVKVALSFVPDGKTFLYFRLRCKKMRNQLMINRYQDKFVNADD